MKTIIYTLGIFALLVSPTTCTKGKFNFQNNSSSSNTSLTSRDGDGEDDGDKIIVIDPTKPIPKP